MLNRNNNSVHCFFLCLGENYLNNLSLYMITDLVILFLFLDPYWLKKFPAMTTNSSTCTEVRLFYFFVLTWWIISVDSQMLKFYFYYCCIAFQFLMMVWFSVLLDLICWYFGQDFPICIYNKGGSAFCFYCWNFPVRIWY